MRPVNGERALGLRGGRQAQCEGAAGDGFQDVLTPAQVDSKKVLNITSAQHARAQQVCDKRAFADFAFDLARVA